MEQSISSTEVWLDFKNYFLEKENVIHNMHFWRGSIPNKEAYIIVNIKWSQACAFFFTIYPPQIDNNNVFTFVAAQIQEFPSVL